MVARVRPLIRVPFLANHPSPCPHPQSESLPATLHIALIKLFTTPMHVGLEEIFVSGTGSSFLTLGRKEKCSFSKNPLLLIVRLMLFQPEQYCRNFSDSTFFRLSFLTIGHGFSARGEVADYAGSMRICAYGQKFHNVSSVTDGPPAKQIEKIEEQLQPAPS